MTHKKNHGDANGIRNILDLRPSEIPRANILIGSPPCTEFSFSNRGGSGDVQSGLRLVYRFLRFVYLLRPKWWVMENVPRVLEFIGSEVELRTLGINRPGTLKIPERRVLASADFGAPQQRMRAFLGNFPVPEPTHGPGRAPWRTLGDVVAALGDPETEPAGVVLDPVYGFQLPAEQLTDHYSDTLRLSDEEVREIRKAKVDHSWYGRMAFPDHLDRPARTVMATQLRVSRESIVVPSRDGYRRLSVREMASSMGFPITYQFWGRTESARQKQVGNAVAPTVAYAIAREIVARETGVRPSRPAVIEHVRDRAPVAAATERRRPRYRLSRSFREHVPGSKMPGFRVDFDNKGSRPGRHLVEWRAVLYRGSGKSLRLKPVGLREAQAVLQKSVSVQQARRFARDVQRKLRVVPDASTLQRIRAEAETGAVTPFMVLDDVSALVSAHFGSNGHVPANGHVPPRIAAALFATAYAAAVANERTTTLDV